MVATLERQKTTAKGKKKWLITKEKRQAEGIIESLGQGINLQMMLNPAGTFWMGAPEIEKDSKDNERPQHLVTLPSFYMGRFQMTQAQWKVIAERTDLDLKVNIDLNPDPSHFKEPYQEYDR